MQNIAVARKLNMTQVFTDRGTVIPVTILYAPPAIITQIKKAASSKQKTDGYDAVQVGYSPKVGGSRKVNKAKSGHLKNITAKVGGMTEFRIKDIKEFENAELGQAIDISNFKVGELVKVVGTSKGRGFAGVVKRHGFAGFPASHGHDHQRKPGSIGQRYPQHTRKGLRMAGHMGTNQVTVKNLQVVEIDQARHLIALKGAVPGANGMMLKIVSTGIIKPLERVVEEKEGKKK